MRCHTCDYSLWNVHGRTCPECGATFNPAEYKFRPNLVEFCCESCGQQYYGTDRNGLLVPPEFDCVKCGAHCSMVTNMVLRAAPGADEGEVQADELPWLRRKAIGRWRAAWRTLWLCIGAPSRVGRGLKGAQETGAGKWLVAICMPTIVLLLLGGTAIGALAFFSGRAGRGGLPTSSQMGEYAKMAGWMFLIPLAGLVVAVGFAAFVTWIVARMSEPDLRFTTVFACWAFAASPAIFLAVPCLGMYCVAPAIVIWVPILAGFMLRECCTARTKYIVIGVAIPPSIVLLAVAGLTALAFYGISTATSQFMAPAGSQRGVPPAAQAAPPASETSTVEDPSP